MGSKRTIEIELLGDTQGLGRALDKANAQLEKYSRKTKTAGNDSDQFGNRAQRLGDKLENANVHTRIFANVLGLVKPAALIAGIGMLASGAAAAGGGVFALGASLAPIAGLGAAAASGLLAAATAAATLKLATSGIGAALKEQTANQAAVGGAAADSGKQQVAAARAIKAAEEQVRSAKDGVRLARQGVADAALGEKRASEDLANALDDEHRAQDGLRNAQAGLLVSQNGLTAAREAGRRTLEDMNDDLQHSVSASLRAASALTDAQNKYNDTLTATSNTLRDLNESLDDSVRGQERASINLQDAEAKLKAVNKDRRSTELDKRRAILDVADATDALSDAQRKQTDLEAQIQALPGAAETAQAQQDALQGVADATHALNDALRTQARQTVDTAAANKAGVEGSREVKDAQAAIAEAMSNVADAARGLTSAHQGVIESQRGVRDADRAAAEAARGLRESQRQVQLALEGVKQAQDDAATSAAGAAGGAAKLNTAMDALPTAAQAFVRELIKLKPKLDELRSTAASGLFPGVTDGLHSVMQNFGPVSNVVGVTARAIGGLAREAGALVGSKAFGKDFESIGRNNAAAMTAGGRGAIALGSGLRHVLVAAEPLTLWVGKLTESWGKHLEQAAANGRESGKLATFFEHTRAVAERLFSILGSLATALFNIGKAATPLGDELWGSIDKAAQRFEDWTKSASGKNALADYFERIKPTIYAIGNLLVDVIKGFGTLSKSSDLGPLIEQVRTQLLPTLVRLVSVTTNSFGPVLVDATVQLGKFFATLSGTSGPLQLFVQILTACARALNFVASSSPAMTALIVTIAALAASLKAVQFASWVTGWTSVSKALAANRVAQIELTGVTNMSTLAAVRQRIANVLVGAAWRASAIAAGLVTAAQWAMNVAMDANPIMLVVIGVAALAAGLIYAYHHSETFRNIITGAFNAVKAAAVYAFGLIKTAAENGMLGPIGLIVTHWTEFTGTITGIWNGVRTAATTAWNAVRDHILEPLRAARDAVGDIVRAVRDKASDAWHSTIDFISKAGDGIKDAITAPFRAAWSVIDDIIKRIGRGLNRIKDAPGKLLKKLHIPGFAGGTNYAPGGLAMVGERGPELVNLPRGSQVYTSSQTAGMMAGGGSGGTTINFNGPVGSQRAARVAAAELAHRLRYS